MRILAISLAYPPLAYPRSVQVARLLKHANVSTVLFCADEPGVRRDETIEPDAEAELETCIRVPVKLSPVAKLANRVTHKFARGVWNRRNLVPDAYGSWKQSVLAAVHDHVRRTNYQPDAVVTFAQPFTDHLIGLELKRRYGFPWLAHFSDPWVDNPFTLFDSATLESNRCLERSVAESAEVLAFTSVETVDVFFSKYPASLKVKSRVLPQCFGDFGPLESGPEYSDVITLRYLGNFYGRRTPKPLIDGLTELFRRNPEALAKVRIELIGPGDAREVGMLAAGLPKGLVGVRPSVSYSESLKLMANADGLLVIDAPAAQSVFLPSKLIDYIGSGQPILGITPAGSAASLIRKLGGRVADPADAALVSEKLDEFIADLRAERGRPRKGPWGDPQVRESFSSARIAAEFTKMIRELQKS